MPGPAEYNIMDLEGIIFGELLSVLTHKPGSRIYRAPIDAHAWLWLRWSLWGTQFGDPITEEVDAGGEDDDDVVIGLGFRRERIDW